MFHSSSHRTSAPRTRLSSDYSTAQSTKNSKEKRWSATSTCKKEACNTLRFSSRDLAAFIAATTTWARKAGHRANPLSHPQRAATEHSCVNRHI
eukprot:1153050-Pelagomonas_calceolata.AAC.11